MGLRNVRKKALISLSAIGLIAGAMIVAAGPASAATSSADPIPWQLRVPPLLEDSSFPAAVAGSLLFPSRDPVGANDWSCRPSTAHPEPVILIHGTWENAYDNWNGLSPILKDQGYCVFALNYGNSTGIPQINATGDMVASANEIATFVKRVAATTGAPHVALVGHSQGGAQARYVTNLLLPRGLVTKVIALTPTNHTTTLAGITVLGDAFQLKQFGFSVLQVLQMPAAVQQASPTAPFYVNLNGHGETILGVDYTVVSTRVDEVVTPYTQAFIKAGLFAKVDNITLQDVCTSDLSEHVSASYSKNVAQIVLNKLDPQHQHQIICYVQTPVLGSTVGLPVTTDRCATSSTSMSLFRWLFSFLPYIGTRCPAS